MSAEAMGKAAISLHEVTTIGTNLERPESVQVSPDGTLYVSHTGGGVTAISPDGKQLLIGQPGMQANGADLVPNGISLLADGNFHIANIGEGGGIWHLNAQTNSLTPFVMEADGQALSAANFVTDEDSGRSWITVSTTCQPRFESYGSDVANGFIVLKDKQGARIVADGLGFANECRVSPDAKHLYVAETFARRVSRFELAANGDLSNRTTFAEFGHGDFPDGIRFDAAGHLWMTSIVSNRLYRIAPDGAKVLVLEDLDTTHVDWVETALAAGEMGREHFYTTGGTALKNIASIIFAGPNNSTAYMGSLANDRLTTFTLPPNLISGSLS